MALERMLPAELGLTGSIGVVALLVLAAAGVSVMIELAARPLAPARRVLLGLR